jgi:hypothetical protein
MAMGSGTLNLESVGSRDEGLALEDAAEGEDLGGGPIREVGESALDDLAVKAGALAEEDGGRGVAVGDGFHVHGYKIAYKINKSKTQPVLTWVQNTGYKEGGFEINCWKMKGLPPVVARLFSRSSA